MTNEEFREMAKALYEPVKQLAHVMKEMEIKDTVVAWMIPQTGVICVDGTGMSGWDLIYDSKEDQWKAIHTEPLKKEFFITLDDDLPFIPERSDKA